MLALGNNYTNGGIYNAGLYLRLSREDEEHTAVSQSIINQKDFLTGYAIQHGINIVDYYIDDGYSGTNFERPDFKRLIDDIENGRINTVITKDLSRLGRDYITTGHYIEKYFPSKNVRYIAVNDGVDTYIENSTDMTPFKAVINDMYAKDLSKKVKTALTTKKLKGQFVGSIAPYGYKKSETDKHKLEIEEEAALIVRRIFKMYIEKQTALGVAKQLSHEKIPTPSAFKNLTATQKEKSKGLWNEVIIKKILSNPTYIGHITQNRTRKVSYKVDKKQSLPKENWIIIENTHEPIISKEDFETVQNILSKKTRVRADKKTRLLAGLVFCSECQRAMTFAPEIRNPNRVYLRCPTRKKYGKLSNCTVKNMREDKLQNHVIEKIKEVARKYLNKEELIKNADTGKYAEIVKNLTAEKTSVNKQLEEIKEIIMSLYKDKVKQIITEQDFIEMSKEFSGQRDRLTERMKQIDQEMQGHNENKTNNIQIEKILKDFLKFEEVDRATLANLIERIEILADKTVVIKFNFIEP